MKFTDCPCRAGTYKCDHQVRRNVQGHGQIVRDLGLCGVVVTIHPVCWIVLDVFCIGGVLMDYPMWLSDYP